MPRPASRCNCRQRAGAAVPHYRLMERPSRLGRWAVVSGTPMRIRIGGVGGGEGGRGEGVVCVVAAG